MINDELPVKPFGELPEQPGYGDTLQAAIERPLYQLGGMAAYLLPQISSEEQRQEIANHLDVLDQTLADPRISNTQGLLDSVAELGTGIASTLPLAGLGGVVGGMAAGDAIAVAGDLLPNAVSKVLRTPINKLAGSAGDYLPKMTPAEFIQHAGAVFGGYKGFIIPQNVVENYQKQNDVLNQNQMIEDWSKDNYGLALPVGLGAAGYLIYKALSTELEAKAKGALAKSMVAEHENVRGTREKLISEAIARSKAGNEAVISAETEEKTAFAKDIISGRETTNTARNKLLADAFAKAKEGKEHALKQSKLEDAMDKALEEGRLTPKEHDAIKYILANPHGDEVIQKALAAMADKSLPIDRLTGKMWFEIMDNKAIGNLKRALADQVAADLPAEQQSLVREYTANNRYDAVASTLNSHPNMKSFMRGLILMADQKLGSKEKILKGAKVLLEEHVFNKEPGNIFDKKQFPYLRLNELNTKKLEMMHKLYDLQHNPGLYTDAFGQYLRLIKEAREKFPNIENEMEYLKGNILSQENIYKHLKETGLPKKGAPYVIPDYVSEKLAIEKRIAQSQDIQDKSRLSLLLKNIEFESINKEIERLANKLEQNIKPNFKQSKEYRRLQDLATTREDAKEVINYLDTIHEYNRQAALTRAMEAFVNMADSQTAKFADPNKVAQYLRSRIEQAAPVEYQALNEINKKLKERETNPVVKVIEPKAQEKAAEPEKEPTSEKEPTPTTTPKPKLNLNEEQIKKSSAEDLKKEYNQEKARYDQVSNNLNILKDAVNCILGKING